MIRAPEHANEKERLEALMRYEVLDSEDEKAFDELTQLASDICGTPISLISLVDMNRQWFKSRVGLDAPETERSIAFCSHAILQDQVFEVENATQDERFHDNPLVTGAPDIRFYAGAPLVTSDGYPLGTLCVIDKEPHKLTEFQKNALKTLANQVISQLETRLHTRKLERLNKDKEKFYALLAHDLRSPFNGILNLARAMAENADKFTPTQVKEFSAEILNSSVTLYQVMDEILQWSQSRLHHTEVRLSPVNILTLSESTTALLKDSSKIKNISINLEIPPDLQAMADETLLKSVLRNLITNAIKFSPSNSSVLIEAHQRNDKIVVSVSDQGEGITEGLKSHLFWNTVDSGTGTSGELGHGLGLSLAGDFIRRQKGRIGLDETYTDGTKICFELGAVS